MTRSRHLQVERLEDRLTPTAGALDPDYGVGGKAFAQNELSNTNGYPAAVDPFGRVVVSYDRRVTRFTADGVADESFGTHGTVDLLGVNGAGDLATDAAGNVFLLDGDNNGVMLVIKLTTSGTLDGSFATGGIYKFTSFTPSDNALASSLAIDATGRVVVDGAAGGGAWAARLTSTGQLDPTFHGGTIDFLPTPYAQTNPKAITFDADGRIVFAGEASGGSAVVRLTTDGTPDAFFPFTFGPNFNNVTDVAVDAAGNFFVSGYSSPGGYTAVPLIAKLTPAGVLDPTFGVAGVCTCPQEIDTHWAIVHVPISLLPDGRVLAASTGNLNQIVVYRLTALGALDPTFNPNGPTPGASAVIFPADSGLGMGGMGLTPDGGVAVGGILFTIGASGPSGPVAARLLGASDPPAFVPTMPGTLTVGGTANGSIEILNPTNGTYSLVGAPAVYGGFAGNIRTTTADVTGDGTLDYIVGAGPGRAPEVTVFDGKTGTVVADFKAFEPTFTGGVFVAAADLDGDQKAEIVVTPDRGGSSRVVVFSIADGGAATPRASFFGIDDPSFRGGARAALGDVNKDGTPDMAVAAGFLGGPRVALFDGTTLFGAPTRLVNDFFAFPGTDAITLRNGTFVALGDLNGDGFADLIFGGGPGGAPRVFILSGATIAGGDVAGAQANPIANFFVAGNSTDRGGVRVAAKATDGDLNADVIAGSGEGDPARVRFYLSKDFSTSSEPGTFEDVSVFGGAVLPGGVFVG